MGLLNKPCSHVQFSAAISYLVIVERSLSISQYHPKIDDFFVVNKSQILIAVCAIKTP